MRKSLEVAIPSGLNRAGTIELLKVNLASNDSPFAMVDYAIDGKEQELSLRLDLDKQVFLDKTGDPCFDNDLQDRAARIVKLVSSYPLLRELQLRSLITKVFIWLFVALVCVLLISVFADVTNYGLSKDSILERILMVADLVLPIITLGLGFYFGTRVTESKTHAGSQELIADLNQDTDLRRSNGSSFSDDRIR